MLVPVNRRDTHTLHGIISRFCEKGSTIYTDGWTAYQGLTEIGFRHFAVNHTETFKVEYIDYNPGETVVVHTNTIEGAWKHAKVRSHFINTQQSLFMRFL